MSETNGRCEWESQDYCCIPEEYKGFVCPSAIPEQPGDIYMKCGATDADLMTEDEWEEQEKSKNHKV